ncbi:hypothetical protein [Gracilibacillus sp. YIM 98692]|uniref:hypothetical protein n=1 Tax=Gracilibacillus sp. YIM 98692 TaxID=2663532 RepID=UPI0013D0CB7A|nr:hypothetical protein [Gracilibacillus sp. YIM 98692]
MADIHPFIPKQAAANAKGVQSPPTLQQGQMLSGKVLELYPNQTAAIQLGGVQVVAQLETALSSKQNYIFQVLSVGNVIRLKKISEAPSQNGQKIKQLLQQLGVSSTNQSKAFFQQIVEQNIPFSKADSQEIVSLLERFGGSQNHREIILLMMAKQLPLKEEVFQSLQAFQSNQIGHQMKALQQMIEQQSRPGNSRLLSSIENRLHTFTSSPSNAIHKGNTQAFQSFLIDNNQSIYQLMQKMNIISNQTSLAKFEEALLTWSHRTSNSDQMLSFSQVKAQLQAALHSQIPMNANEQQAFKTIMPKFLQALGEQRLVHDIKASLQNSSILQKMGSALTDDEENMLHRWVMDSNTSDRANRSAYELLHRTLHHQLTSSEITLARDLLFRMNDIDSSSPMSIKEHFLNLTKQFLQVSGVQDETQLKSRMPEGELSLKQLLMLAGQQSDDLLGERMLKLVQTITGMQLNMTNSDDAISQWNIQIPADKLGLPKDIRMQFEGKRRESGTELDPNYCQILFHLELNKLGETMIAVSIQKRVIQITVYNDQAQTKSLLQGFKPLLKEKLSELNYQLSTVTWKSLDQKETYTQTQQKNNYKMPVPREGIDFRV